jgi:hypothetical protein
MDFDCLINNFKEYGDLYREFPKGVVLYINGEDNKDSPVWIFYSNGYWAQYTSDPSQYEGSTRQFLGEWKCDGENHFFINDTGTNKKYSSKTGEWKPVVPDTLAQLNPSFSCVTSGLASMGLSFQIKDNRYVVATLKSNTKWYFYNPKPDTKTWVEYDYNTKNITLQGTWSCLGESNFQLTRSDGKTFVGGDTSWKDETQSGTTTEPTHDETKFPLKKGSRGPEVVQLQNYLNKQIPQDPLVTDGIFGDKTYNKLVQLQKSTGLI